VVGSIVMAMSITTPTVLVHPVLTALDAVIDAVTPVNGPGAVDWFRFTDPERRWLNCAPEDFLSGQVVDVGDVRLPEAAADSRLRWDLNQLHTALNEQRRRHDLTWAALAKELGCTPARLTDLRTARLADMNLVMHITQWLGQPAATFIHPAQW